MVTFSVQSNPGQHSPQQLNELPLRNSWGVQQLQPVAPGTNEGLNLSF